MTLIECSGKLSNSETNSDVSFVFANANTKYYAHKLILSARSDVFNAMFYGDITKSTTNCDRNNSIEIVDIKPENFFELLRLIYTDQITTLNDSNFAELVYATEKYNIQFFGSICAKFLSETLNTDNVFSYFQQCYVYENAASEECLMFIDWAIADLVEIAKPEDLCEEALTIIVERDTLKIKEFDLFKFVMKWSDVNSAVVVPNAKRLKLDGETHDAEPNAMLPIFRIIRYPTMSLEEFGQCYKLKREYFPPADVLNIFQYLSLGTRNDNLSYSTRRREFDPKFTDKLNVIKFSPLENHGTTTCFQQCDIRFTVNRPVTLCELRFTSIVMSGSLYNRTESLPEQLYHFENSFKQSLNIVLLPNVPYELSVKICDCGHESHKIPYCTAVKQNCFNFAKSVYPFIIHKFIFTTQKNENVKRT